MNKTNIPCSLEDTEELRKMIIENPTLPLVTFVSEEAINGDYPYSYADVTSIKIKESAIWNDEWWCDYDDYREKLSDNLCEEEEFENLSDEEFERMLDEKMAAVEFVKAIVINIG